MVVAGFQTVPTSHGVGVRDCMTPVSAGPSELGSLKALPPHLGLGIGEMRSGLPWSLHPHNGPSDSSQRTLPIGALSWARFALEWSKQKQPSSGAGQLVSYKYNPSPPNPSRRSQSQTPVVLNFATRHHHLSLCNPNGRLDSSSRMTPLVPKQP